MDRDGMQQAHQRETIEIIGLIINMNGINWKAFVDSIREEGSYRNRIKSLDADMGDYLDTGPHKKGSPYKTKRAHFRRKKFNDVSAPPGAPGGLEEEVEAASFDSHEALEPRIWDGEEMKSKVEARLVKIAQDFMDSLPIELDIKDIRLTGSLANYNWSNYSDLDLHIVIDFLEIDENHTLVKALFDNARMRWNNKHHIRVKGYDVEIYVEDDQEHHMSSGVYSLMTQEWLKKPKKFRNSVDFSTARRKAEDIEFQASIINNLITARKFKAAFKNIERLKAKIKNMRRAGLESELQEFSVENIAFKILRRNGTLEMLSDLKDKMYDTMMSIREE